MTTSLTCSRCATPRVADARFCSKCGFQIPPDADASKLGPTAETTEQGQVAVVTPTTIPPIPSGKIRPPWFKQKKYIIPIGVAGFFIFIVIISVATTDPDESQTTSGEVPSTPTRRATIAPTANEVEERTVAELRAAIAKATGTEST